MAANGSVTGPIADLIEAFGKFPTVGPKTAARLAFFLLSRPRHEAQALADAIIAVKDKVRFCSVCFGLTESDPCEICRDERRENVICVVADAKDIFAIERTGSYKGRYHVLGGLISPIDGVGPAQLHVRELLERIEKDHPREIIVATNPNAEGEATALYLSRTIGADSVKVTRLAYGLPIGGDLDYADEITLSKSLEGRTAL